MSPALVPVKFGQFHYWHFAFLCCYFWVSSFPPFLILREPVNLVLRFSLQELDLFIPVFISVLETISLFLDFSLGEEILLLDFVYFEGVWPVLFFALFKLKQSTKSRVSMISRGS